MWFPEGNTLPAQSLGFPLQGRLPGVAPTLSLFQGEVALSSVLEVSKESLGPGTLWSKTQGSSPAPTLQQLLWITDSLHL